METDKIEEIRNIADMGLSEQAKKILVGLDLVSQKLIKEAKEKKEELVVSQDGKIVRLKFD